MPQNPMLQPDSYDSSSSWDERSHQKSDEKSGAGKSAAHLGDVVSAGDPRDVAEVARALAAHGGGEASFELALDLVLHEVVEQARLATGATGAAIALARADEMICRATTGADAPELGVRLEMTSGLSGACLHTGTIQRCSDTETDPRVNAEDCRRLGVRSIVMLPLELEGNDGKGEGKERFGILQAFSSWPNAFSDRDVNTLQALARRVVENVVAKRMGTEAAATAVPGVSDKADAPVQQLQSSADEGPLWPVDARNPGEEESSGADGARTSAWTSVLGLLVILLAVVLGMALGWRAGLGRGLRGTPATARSIPKSNQGSDSAGERETTAAAGTEVAPAGEGTAASAKTLSAGSAVEPPSGGLLVTENGKVIYRLPTGEKVGGAARRATSLGTSLGTSTGSSTGSSSGADEISATRLIHRVEPLYPAEASAKQIQGVVTLEVQIGTDGAVHNITV